MVIYQKTSTKTYGVGIFITTDMASPFVKYMIFFLSTPTVNQKIIPIELV